MGIKRMMVIKKREKRRDSFTLLFVLVVTSILTSCSHSIKVRTPSSRFISPEAGGRLFASEVSGFYAAGTRAKVNLKNEKVDDPLVLDNDTALFDSIGLNASIGLHEKFDLVMSAGGNHTPTLFGIKYQLIGKKRKDAKKGDQSLAITIMNGTSGQTQESGEDLELTPQDDDTKVELDRDVMDYSIIYGKRLSDTGLAYAGLSYTSYKFKGTLDSQSSELNNKVLKNSGEIIGAHIGYISYVNKILSLKIETSAQQVNWDYTKAKTFGYISGGMAFYWD